MPVPTVRAAALAVAGAACLLVPALGAAAPSFQVVDAGPAVPGLSTADEIAGELLSPGVALAGPATINGTATAGAYAAALPSFGRFDTGTDDIGIADGLVIGANARAGSFATGNFDDLIATNRDDDELFDVINAAGLCGVPNAAACINNATSIELSVTPTARYLKFEYALAVTEVGTWNGSSWSGDVFTFPDGFALFVGGRQVADNCAVLPRTSTYVTMQTAGVVARASSGTNRSIAQSNLDARIADTATPPVTPNGFAYAAQDGAWAVQFMTVPLTCVADVNAAFLAGTPTGIKIVVADANDSAIPPAVFLRGDSIRFSDNETPSPTVDAPATPGSPPPTTAPAPAPPAPASPLAEVVTPLAPPTVRTPKSGTPGDVVMVHRIQFDKVGRYTFIYRNAATGKRITQLPGSRVGKRDLTSRYSAPVLRNEVAGRRLVLTSRFDARTFPKSGSGVSLRIVLKTPDGTLSDVTMDSEGRLS